MATIIKQSRSTDELILECEQLIAVGHQIQDIADLRAALRKKRLQLQREQRNRNGR